MSSNNKYRLYWYLVSLAVLCADGTTSFYEVNISADRACVTIYALEGCRKSAIRNTEGSISASIQSVSYLGFMTKDEFFGESQGNYVH